MKITRGIIFFHSIWGFTLSIGLMIMVLPNNGLTKENNAQLVEAEKLYERSYNFIRRREVKNVEHKVNQLYGIIDNLYPNRPQITIYDSPSNSPSALCFPDKKHIFVSIELLARIKHKDEIAFILAHELYHIINHYHDSQRAKMALSRGVQESQIKVNTDNTITLVEQIEMLEARHEIEFEADKGALNFMGRNYSSSKVIPMLIMLGKSILNQRSDTHPSILERINKIESLALYQNHRNKPLSPSALSDNISLSNHRRGANIDQKAIKRAVAVMSDYYKKHQ